MLTWVAVDNCDCFHFLQYYDDLYQTFQCPPGRGLIHIYNQVIAIQLPFFEPLKQRKCMLSNLKLGGIWVFQVYDIPFLELSALFTWEDNTTSGNSLLILNRKLLTPLILKGIRWQVAWHFSVSQVNVGECQKMFNQNRAKVQTAETVGYSQPLPGLIMIQ